MPVDAALRRLVAQVGAFHITDRAMLRAQRAIEAALRARRTPAPAERRGVSARPCAATSPASSAKRARICATSTAGSNGSIRSVQPHRRTRRRGQADRGDARRPLHALAGDSRPHEGARRASAARPTGFFEYAGGLTLLSAESAGVHRPRCAFASRETFAQAYLLGVQSLVIVAAHLALHRHGHLARVGRSKPCRTASANLVGGAVAFTHRCASSGRCSRRSSSPAASARRSRPSSARWSSPSRSRRCESLGLSPARMLVVPRLLALLVMLPLLTIFADVVSIVGGMWIAQDVRAHPLRVVHQLGRASRSASSTCSRACSKRSSSRSIIAMVGAYQGLSTRGGAAGVGQVDDRRGRHLDHPDLHFQLRALVPALRQMNDGARPSYRPDRRRRPRLRRTRRPAEPARLDIVEGAITCIIGLSGAGKSTILRLLDGLHRARQRARLRARQRHLPHVAKSELIDVRQKIGFSFQFAALFDSLTVGDNVALPLREHTKLSEAEIRTHGRWTRSRASACDDAYDKLPGASSRAACSSAPASRGPIVTRPELRALRRADDRPRSDHHPRSSPTRSCSLRATAQRHGGRHLARPADRSLRWPTTSRCSSRVRSSPTTRSTDPQLLEPDRPAVLAGFRGRPDSDLAKHLLKSASGAEGRRRGRARSCRALPAAMRRKSWRKAISTTEDSLTRCFAAMPRSSWASLRGDINGEALRVGRRADGL